MSTLNNLSITTTSKTMTSATGHLLDFLHGAAGNGGRDQNCKFYYNNGAGGSLLQVVAKSVVGGVVAELKDVAENHFNRLMNGKKTKETIGKAWIESGLIRQEEEAKIYGMMEVDGGTIYALDDWGCQCPDALMLGIKTDQEIKVKQSYPIYRTKTVDADKGIYQELAPDRCTNELTTTSLVWYDTTAIININSDKNIVVSKVQGRDYSRKELVSNGDIKFTVSGQITSGYPDIYPSEEVKKFIKVMQYKGIVKVNNQILDQFGISHIVITDFNLQSKQGYKAVQNYTFSAIGLQPEKEIVIENDTLDIVARNPVAADTTSGSWVDMLNAQLDGLKSAAGDIFSQGLGIATGLLDNIL